MNVGNKMEPTLNEIEKKNSEEFNALRGALRNLFLEEYYSKKFIQKGLPNSELLHIPLRATQTQPLPGLDAPDFEVENKLFESISDSSGPLSTLLLGDSGTGKSWLALQSTYKLLNCSTTNANFKIPIYIPLRSVEQYQNSHGSIEKPKDILLTYLQKHSNYFPNVSNEFQLRQAYSNLLKFELLLFLDGYDELQDKVNLWRDNHWDDSNCLIRTFAFCRSSALLSFNVGKQFEFYKNGTKNAVHYLISPLDKALVSEFINRVPKFLRGIDPTNQGGQSLNDPWMMTKQTTAEYPKWESIAGDSEYHHWFFLILPELENLSQNVFLLTTICQILPHLVEAERSTISTEASSDNDAFLAKMKEICKTEVTLYDKFTQAWVDYQIDRIVRSREPKALYEISTNLSYYMFAYAQNLALHYIHLNSGYLSNGEVKIEDTEMWNLWVPWFANPSEFIRETAKEHSLFPENEEDKNEEKLRNLQALRNACLIRYNPNSKVFTFFHLSLLEYFASREVFSDLRAQLNFYANNNRTVDSIYFPINQVNINHTNFQGVLAMLVDKAKVDPNFQALLTKTVKMSAELPGIKQMASNAISILNLSGFSFSGNHEEFQNIQVPHANLSKAICGNSDFRGANFEGANLSQGWFQNCRFQGVNFKKCVLGKVPSTHIGECTAFVYDMRCTYYPQTDSFHVVIICLDVNPRVDSIELCAKNYAFASADFQLTQNCTIVLNKTVNLDYRQQKCFLVGESDKLFLLVYSSEACAYVPWLSHIQMLSYPDVPILLYEFNFTTLVNTFTFGPNNLSIDFILNFESSHLSKKYILLNGQPRFCTFQEFGAHLRSNVNAGEGQGPTFDITRFTWLPIGPIKVLVSTVFKICNGAFTTLTGLTELSMLHNDLPIVSENLEEDIGYDIHWENIEPPDSLLSGIYFNGSSILSLSLKNNLNGSLKSNDGHIFFFDLNKNVLLKSIGNISNAATEHMLKIKSQSEFIVHSSYALSSWCDNQVTFEQKLNLVSRDKFKFEFSRDLSFVGVSKPSDSFLNVLCVETGKIVQNLVKDEDTPYTFFTHPIKAATHLFYIRGNNLHFATVELVKSGQRSKRHGQVNTENMFVSRDGTFLVTRTVEESDSNSFDLLTLFSIDTDYKFTTLAKTRLPESRAVMQCANILILSNRMIVCKIFVENHTFERKLLGFEPTAGQQIQVLNVPRNNTFSIDDQIELIQWNETVILRCGTEFSCYSFRLTSNGSNLTLTLNIISTVNFTNFPASIQVDANAPEICYIFNDLTIENPETLGLWNFEKNTCTTLKMKHQRKLDASQPISIIPTLNEIYVGNSDVVKGKVKLYDIQRYTLLFIHSISVERFIQRLTPGLVNSRSRARACFRQVQHSLGWIVVLFRSGELIILDSKTLNTMFSFDGFHPACKFQVVEKDTPAIQVVVWSSFGHLTWITINCDSLRKSFEQNSLKTFNDWRVNKFEIPSSTLSLQDTDISYSRAMADRILTLFQFYACKGEPVLGEKYEAFCDLFIPVTDSFGSIFTTVKGNKNSDNLERRWRVTIIAKKQYGGITRKPTIDSHGGLIVEGIKNKRHFVIRGDLTRINGIVRIKVRPVRNKTSYEKIKQNYVAKQIQISPTDGMMMLKSMWEDRQRHWKYHILYRNCNTWCRKKLKLVGIVTKPKFRRLYIHLPQDFFKKSELEEQLNDIKLQIKLN